MATMLKHNMKGSRLQEATGVLQERGLGAMGDLAKGGKFLLDFVSTHNPAPAAILGNLALPNDYPLESLVANLVARKDRASSKVNLKPVHDQTAVISAGLGGYGKRAGYREQSAPSETQLIASQVHFPEEEYYQWETDPNGGWLASFT